MKNTPENHIISRQILVAVLLFIVFQMHEAVAQSDGKSQNSHGAVPDKLFNEECQTLAENIEIIFELLSDNYELGTAFSTALVHFKVPELINVYSRLCKR